MVQGEWGPLQVLHLEYNDEVIDQATSILNEWGVAEYKAKLNKKVEKIKPFALSKV